MAGLIHRDVREGIHKLMIVKNLLSVGMEAKEVWEFGTAG